jgi:predicted ester cyclase
MRRVKLRGTKLLALEVENRERARRGVEALWADDEATIADLVAADHVAHLPGGVELDGREDLRAYVDRFREGIADLRVSADDDVAELDTVVLRLELRGRHEGPVLGVDPTGREVTVPAVAFVRVQYGRLVESWYVFDTLAALTDGPAAGREATADDGVHVAGPSA